MSEVTLADIEGKVEETEVEAVDGDNQPEEEVQEEESTEKPTDEQSGDDEPKDEKEEEPKPKKENHDDRRWKRILQERAEYKAKAELYEQQAQQQQPKQEVPNEGRPARADFDNDEDYVDSLTTWKVEQKLAGVRQELTQSQMQSQAQASWGTKVDQARTDYADYDTVMEDAQDIPITPAVVEALQSSDIGADVAYHLAKHPEKAERLNTLSPIAAAREIGRIESLVEGSKAKPAKRLSGAPAPIKPVRNTASKGTGKKSLDDMSPEEYMAHRNKQEQSRGRRR